MEFSQELKQLLGALANPQIVRQMGDYLALLQKWNTRINLTASAEWDVIRPMFREALWAATFYPEDAVFHLDIGSGAGFPALPIKILVPRIALDLVESRERKCQFLETAVHTLGLEGVRVHNARFSGFLSVCGEEKKWDCVSWKALKLGAEDLRQLHKHAHPNTQVWMLHGREPALQDGVRMEPLFEMERMEKTPGRRDWNLSVYRAVRGY
ncbi:MAG: rsmG [Acidobacteria bacterium]|jgi:16S rRNA (guanine527-N7)-methyltransferase|nr:rsmG [Acidobacteriota bacterium]